MARAQLATPIGEITVITTAIGVSRVWFGALDEESIDASEGAERHRDRAVAQIDEYFAGTRRSFDVTIDRRGRVGFRGEVLDALEEVAFGETVTYRQLASRAGRPRAARAVGTAMATNPIAIIVPCHRVLPSGGGVGRFGGGTEAKAWLLRHEGRRG